MTITISKIKTLRDSPKAFRYALGLLKRHEQRMEWSREIIENERLRKIKSLIMHSKQHSPWHRERLLHINCEDITIANFSKIPSMNKNDLMSHWDDIVTDKNLNLRVIEKYLNYEKDLNFEIADKYNIVVTGGSSGKRGIFVYSIPEWAHCYCTSIRSFMPVFKNKILDVVDFAKKVTIAAPLSNHMTSNLTQNFSNPKIKDYYLPVTENLNVIINTLNTIQPDFLQGYPTMIRLLAEQQRAGILSIHPAIITTLGEPLYDEVRLEINKIWGSTIFNVWACGEAGVLGMNCPVSSSLHLNEDMHYIEPLNHQGILLTNLFSRTLPLIRYEIDDEITIADHNCQCGSHYQLVKEVQGRFSENFIYPGNILVHSSIFRNILHKYANIFEFQIRQIINGAEIDLLVNPSFSTELLSQIKDQFFQILNTLGLDNPSIIIKIVTQIDMTTAGKIKRYIPLKRK